MVLIFSSEEDRTTNRVIEWLNHYQLDYYRINESTFINIDYLNISNNNTFNFQITCFKNGANRIINSNEIRSVWYRRGQFKLKYKVIPHKFDLSTEVNKYLNKEYDAVVNILYELLKQKFVYINSYLDNSVTKLKQIVFAANCGLKIPDSIITNQHKHIKLFSQKNGTLITKGIETGLIHNSNKIIISTFTEEITTSDIDSLDSELTYTLCQDKIEKKFDVRIFAYNKEFFASAIFSQNDLQTSVDFRKYNWDRPNRIVPLNLPNEIKLKLIHFMEAVDVNCGSIDMVYNDKNEFIFLEINPVGQFEQIYFPCNYHLDKYVADILNYNSYEQ